MKNSRCTNISFPLLYINLKGKEKEQSNRVFLEGNTKMINTHFKEIENEEQQ